MKHRRRRNHVAGQHGRRGSASACMRAAPRCAPCCPGAAPRAPSAPAPPACSAVANERRLLDGADFFLSILPPGEAEALARQLAPALTALDRRSRSMSTATRSARRPPMRIAAIVAPTGAEFVDGGIIGGPPRPGYSPAIYASGPAVGETAVLRDWGIDWRVIDGPIGAASGAQDVLCRDHQGHHRDRLGDAAGRRALRLRRSAGRRIVAEPTASLQIHSRQASADVRQGLSLGGRDGGDLGFSNGSYKPAADIYAAIARHYECARRRRGGNRSSVPTTRSRPSTGCWGDNAAQRI